MEIHHIEDTEYTRAGGKNFPATHPDRSNRYLEEYWSILEIVSQGSLSTPFDELYWEGGAWSPAYDIDGELGDVPPMATVQSADAKVEVLLPAYRSLVHRGNLRPAHVGMYVHQDQKIPGEIFIKNMEYMSTPLINTLVYAVLRRPDGSALLSEYESDDDFRMQYYSVITGEQGEVLTITQDKKKAKQIEKAVQISHVLDDIAADKVVAPTLVKALPRFVQSVWVRSNISKLTSADK